MATQIKLITQWFQEKTFHKYESHASDLLGLSQSWFSCFFLVTSLLYRNLYKISFSVIHCFCYTLLNPVRAKHLLSELKEPTHLSCPPHSLLWFIWKVNQRRISFLAALLEWLWGKCKRSHGECPQKHHFILCYFCWCRIDFSCSTEYFYSYYIYLFTSSSV